MTGSKLSVFTVPGLLKAFLENYTRLAKNPVGMSSLWRGDDHLVYVRGTGFLLPFTEEYKRYRFQDIQAISIAKRSRVGKSILFGMGMILCAIPVILILLLTAESPGGVAAFFLSAFSLCFLLLTSLLVRHLVLGPVCTCDIQTALSRDRIRPLNRYFRTLEVIRSIKDEVRGAQVDLLETGTPGSETQPAPAGLLSGFSVPGVAIPTFVVSMVFALGTLAALHLESIALCGILLLVVLILSILLQFSLIASVRKATPEAVRTSLWVLLGLLFLFISGSVVYLLVAVTKDPAYTIGITGPLEAFAGVANEGGIVFYLFFLVISMIMFGCGMAGLLQTIKWKGKVQSGDQPDGAEEGSDG